MTDREVTVNAADLEAVLAQDWAVPSSSAYSARDRLRAAIAPPAPPWEPSEQAITDFCNALVCGTGFARARLAVARERGWDARPVRLGREWSDDDAAAFWRLVGEFPDTTSLPDNGHRAIARLEAAGWRLSPPEGEK